MTIVSGNLTLPNQLTIQGWLAQFFSRPPDDYGLDSTQTRDFNLTSFFDIEAPPNTIFGFSEVTVTLIFAASSGSGTAAKDRPIQSMIIRTLDGLSMEIEFVSPKTATQYFELLDGGNGAAAFYDSIQPNEGGFFSQTGSEGDDFMEGFPSADTFVGGGGGDIIIGRGGNDFIDGGPGSDTAQYSGSSRDHTIQVFSDKVTVTDRSPDGDGTDTLNNIEMLDFSGSLVDDFVDLESFLTFTGLSEAELKTFVELYIAYFNRAPDAVGLVFWGAAFANGTTLEEMAALFIDQDETRELYAADLSNSSFATAAYGNVLGRVADQVGFDFWVGALDSGGVGRDQFILSMLEGAKANPPDGANADFITQQLADQAYLNDKTNLGTYFAITKGLSNVDDARAAMSIFDGTDASLNTAMGAIDEYHRDAITPTDGEFVVDFVGFFDDPFGM